MRGVLCTRARTRRIFFLKSGTSSVRSFVCLFPHQRFRVLENGYSCFSVFPSDSVIAIKNGGVFCARNRALKIGKSATRLLGATGGDNYRVTLFKRARVPLALCRSNIRVIGPKSYSDPHNKGPACTMVSVLRGNVVPVVVRIWFCRNFIACLLYALRSFNYTIFS